MDESVMCPICTSKGTNNNLILRQISLTTAVYLCNDVTCPYPEGYSWVEINRSLGNIFSKKQVATVGGSFTDTVELDQWLNEIFDDNIGASTENKEHNGSGFSKETTEQESNVSKEANQLTKECDKNLKHSKQTIKKISVFNNIDDLPVDIKRNILCAAVENSDVSISGNNNFKFSIIPDSNFSANEHKKRKNRPKSGIQKNKISLPKILNSKEDMKTFLNSLPSENDFTINNKLVLIAPVKKKSTQNKFDGFKYKSEIIKPGNNL